MPIVLSTVLFLLSGAVQGKPAYPWPAVPGASVRRWSVKPEPEPDRPDVPLPGGLTDSYQMELKTAPKGRTLEFLFQAKPGTILNYGPGHQFVFKGGRLVVVDRTTVPEMGMSGPAAYDVAFVQSQKTVTVYCNGSAVTRFESPKSFLLDIEAAKDGLLAQAVYPRALSAAEVAKNAKAADAGAEALLPETKTITLGVRLDALTPVPDPARIKPYRNALVAEEYTVLSLERGHRKGLKPGTKLRVFRYGVFDGQKTDIQYLKVGDRVSITVQPLDANPVLQREYQLDELSSDFSSPYYVEVRGNR